MKTRLVLVASGCCLAASALIWSQSSTAQSDEPSGGLFATLKVGQMVEVGMNTFPYVIRTYDDPAMQEAMTARITEIGRDFMALELADPNNKGALYNLRLPAHSLMSIWHVSGSVGAAPRTGTRPATGTKGTTKGTSPKKN